MAIEDAKLIVSFPMKNGDFPWLCKHLPEGISSFSYGFPMIFQLFYSFPMIFPFFQWFSYNFPIPSFSPCFQLIPQKDSLENPPPKNP